MIIIKYFLLFLTVLFVLLLINKKNTEPAFVIFFSFTSLFLTITLFVLLGLIHTGFDPVILDLNEDFNWYCVTGVAIMIATLINASVTSFLAVLKLKVTFRKLLGAKILFFLLAVVTYSIYYYFY